MSAAHLFSGSYRPGEVAFLLAPTALPDTPVAAKEKLMQQGLHYGRLLSHETAPAADYVRLFHQGLADTRTRLAGDAKSLARRIADRKRHAVTLVSLARAGTPFGVLLKHLLAQYHGIEAAHYSISLLKGVGIDHHALRFITGRHPADSIVFVDGWTGKGGVARELYRSLRRFNANSAVPVPGDLYVIADLCGYAAFAATSDDYLIPSCILNATVSGLVSRSIFPDDTVSGRFHGCVYYSALEPHDLSRYFVDTLLAEADRLPQQPAAISARPDPRPLRATARRFLSRLRLRYRVADGDLVKPGIGEATRALLRRQARLLLLRNPEDDAVRHLRWLADAKAVAIEANPAMPYRAAALITEHQP